MVLCTHSGAVEEVAHRRGWGRVGPGGYSLLKFRDDFGRFDSPHTEQGSCRITCQEKKKVIYHGRGQLNGVFRKCCSSE